MSQGKVLVVDDQPHIVRLIEINLVNAGYEVITAGDGVTGFELARTEKPDLIILDVIMPRRDGFAVLRDLRADPELAQIPVIMFTVKAQNHDIAEGLREGADLYLPKPFHPHELVSCVSALLRSKSSPPEA